MQCDARSSAVVAQITVTARHLQTISITVRGGCSAGADFGIGACLHDASKTS